MNGTLFGKLLSAFLRHRDRRRAIHALHGLDDHLLKDIGIDRYQIEIAVEGMSNDEQAPTSIREERTHPAEDQAPLCGARSGYALTGSNSMS